jgi:hypothetical protein
MFMPIRQQPTELWTATSLRLLKAIFYLGNDDPDLVGAHRGMGTKIGAGLSLDENRLPT